MDKPIRISEIHRVTIYDWMTKRLRLKDAQLYVFAAHYTAGCRGIPGITTITTNIAGMLGLGRSTFSRAREELVESRLIGFTDGPVRIYYARQFLPETETISEPGRECACGAIETEKVFYDKDESESVAAKNAYEETGGMTPDVGCESQEFKIYEGIDDQTAEMLDDALSAIDAGLSGLRLAGREICRDIRSLQGGQSALGHKMEKMSKHFGSLKSRKKEKPDPEQGQK